ncbi:MAG: hypothetical protein ACYC1E_15760 [Propionibacteriaceae bacterium]
MANKQHGRGRGRQPQRRHLSPTPVGQPRDAQQQQQLFQSLRAALRSGEPLDLLAIVSGFLEVTDPRSRDPFAPDERRTSLVDLVDSLVGTPYAETTAALAGIRALVTDEALAVRIGRELETRRHPMPAWLSGLAGAEPDPEVWLMTHVLGDGDDYLVGVTLPTGESLSALVYVDHNLGSVVKDAFVVPEPLQDVAIKMGTLIDDADQSLTRTDPATARAVIEAAIEVGSRLYPPVTSESWPMCRPLVEWMLRMLPAGGEAPERKNWTPQESAKVAADFFASPYAAGLDDDERRSLLDSVLWFATDYATGDPWRWSPVTVEMLLADWFPRKVIADPAFLAKLPDLLRAYIRYCHHRNQIRADLTQQTLAAVDQYQPKYLHQIRGDRQQAMAALTEAILESQRVEHLSDDQIHLEYLADEVGGLEALMRLDTEPLPNEEFDWDGIDEKARPGVQVVLHECDAGADAILDVEHRTAMRRFLARAARNDPRLFQRTGSPVRGAAALAWIIATANRTIGSYRSPLSGKDLLAHFGITGSVTDRTRSLLRAAGIELRLTYGHLRLGDPTLLVSRPKLRLL